MRAFRSVFLALSLVLMSCNLISAQVNTATITGVVTDTSGAALPGTKITLVNTGTNSTVTVKSNGSGLFTIPQLQPGDYKARAEHSGFRAVEKTGVALTVGEPA